MKRDQYDAVVHLSEVLRDILALRPQFESRLSVQAKDELDRASFLVSEVLRGEFADGSIAIKSVGTILLSALELFDGVDLPDPLKNARTLAEVDYHLTCSPRHEPADVFSSGSSDERVARRGYEFH